MSRFFPHPEYAEEQPLYHTILNTHIAHRGFQTGAAVGILSGAAQVYLFRRRLASIRASEPTKLVIQTPRVLQSIGRSAIITTAIMAPATIYHMWGREEIEWRDRSWRLLENKGQVECDDWSLVGTLVGAVGAARGAHFETTGRGKVLRIAGGAGVGTLLGTAGYMIWRYGMHGGKRDEAK